MKEILVEHNIKKCHIYVFYNAKKRKHKSINEILCGLKSKYYIKSVSESFSTFQW